MSEPDAIRKGQLLEDEFFHRLDQDLRAQLRRTMERDALLKQLAAATGLKNPRLLDRLADRGFEVATVAALALVPTVLVAWADGWVSPPERQAVLTAATQRGLDHQPTALCCSKRGCGDAPRHRWARFGENTPKRFGRRCHATWPRTCFGKSTARRPWLLKPPGEPSDTAQSRSRSRRSWTRSSHSWTGRHRVEVDRGDQPVGIERQNSAHRSGSDSAHTRPPWDSAI